MKKYLISIDRLIINLRIEKQSPLRKVITGGKLITEHISLFGEFNPIAHHHRNIVKVYLLGEHVGTISHNAQAFKHNSRVQFFFNKPILYNGQWYKAISRLIAELSMEYRGIHSMEIAYDSVGLLSQLREWYYMSTLVGQDKFKPYGRKAILPYSKSNNGIDTFYFGGKKVESDIETTPNPVITEVKVYDKLKAAIDKNEIYFLDYYKKNGFSLDEGIDRCELYIRGWKINGVIEELKMLTKEEVLVSILKEHARNYLKWYDLTDYKWQNGNKVYQVVELIDFDNLKAANIQFKKLGSVKKHKLKSNKSTVIKLYNDYICGGYMLLRDTLVYYIFVDEVLKEWTLLRYKQFKVDYERECEDGVKERIEEMDLIFTRIMNGLEPFDK